MSNVWPEFFPPGCPREPHTCRPGIYIRLVSRKPTPPDEDFLPQIIDLTGIRKKEGRGSVCKSCALSVFSSQQAAEDFLDNQGEGFRYRCKARMEVRDGDGVIHSDDSSYPGHCLWWIPMNQEGRSYWRFFRGCVDDA